MEQVESTGQVAGYTVVYEPDAPARTLAILDLDGAPLAAISIAAPTMRVSAKEFDRVGVAPLLKAEGGTPEPGV